MNTIAITVTLALEEQNPEDAYLDFLLTIDGQYIHDSQNHWVDPVDLAASAASAGEFFIFTCNCGDPTCVGIDEGVFVSHAQDTVTWRVRNPLGWMPGEELPEWTHEVEYSFPREEYIRVVGGALSQAKTLVHYWRAPGRIWVGPDLDVEELLSLEIPGGFEVAGESDSRIVH
ncbi:MAG: hypothetical protein V3573_14335 [Desulfovibrionaceae bacterium]